LTNPTDENKAQGSRNNVKSSKRRNKILFGIKIIVASM
jgi:hypothetical protein